MSYSPGSALRTVMAERDITCFIGVYDVFSATLAAKHFDGIFVSGFGFAASHYGLPDIGFIAWTDMLSYVQRIRTVLPRHHIMVDIDDGYCDVEVAAHMVVQLEKAGASGVIMEDQKRPRRCGHYTGKQLLELDQFIEKLNRVLEVRQDLVVVARTDATDEIDRMTRAKAFESAGADAILVDGLEDLTLLKKLSRQLKKPIMFNQIAGGKSPRCGLSYLKECGVSLVNYSTPCLFAAQEAVDRAVEELARNDGTLPDVMSGGVGVSHCTAVLKENLVRRDSVRPTPPVSSPSAEVERT